MKKILLVFTFLILNYTAIAQHNDTWTSFWNKDTTLIGFKDKEGKIKIEPKFMGFTTANKFENIIAVTEEYNKEWKSYYLTKQGKIVGIDSLYTFDNGPDCENEGFIRFRDQKTDKMGIFNGEGKIVIPAEYSSVSKVQNGMILVLKGAEKVMLGFDGHFSWAGGKDYLIDTNNKILIEDFDYNDQLNFYSVQKSKEPSKDPIRDNFLAVDGEYYSFINFDKEFKHWLENTILSDISKANLEKHSWDNITYWKETTGWINAPKATFINKNYAYLKFKLQELKNPKCDYFISTDGLNQFIFETEEYDTFFNGCNESIDWKYPVKNIVINPKNKNHMKQDHIQFLRTENGYKLLCVAGQKDNLK